MSQKDFAALMQQVLAMAAEGGGGVPSHGSPLVKSFDQMAQESYGPDYTGDVAIAGLRETLAKAMGIGDLSAYGVTGTTPLQLENLDATMTEVLVTEQFMKLFNAIPRVPSKNALYQWNRKKSYGSFRGTAGFREGGAPQGSASKYQRDTATIRYLGERGGVTHQLAVAGAAGGVFLDPTAEENRNTTIRLLAKIERAIMRGRSDILDEDGNTVNYDGLITQMKASSAGAKNVIDKQGAAIDFDDLEGMAYNFFTNGKMLSFAKVKGYATGSILADLGAVLRETERSTLTGSGKGDLIPGTPFGGWQSQFGFVPMEPSQFLDEVEGDLPVAEADPGAPAAPAAPTTAAASDATSKIPAASYYYFASAINSKGESLATATAAAQAVTAGQKVTVTIPRVSGATGYRLYRGTAATADKSGWIATIAQPGSGNASYVDLNQKVPGSGTAVYFHADPQDLAIAQLAPLVKWPLAIVDTTVQFLLLLYHTLVVKAPERIVIFENVGRAS
jgi:hypothetical protein